MPRGHPRSTLGHLNSQEARALQREITADGRWYAEVFALAQGLAVVEVFPSVHTRSVSRRLRCREDWRVMKEEASDGRPIF